MAQHSAAAPARQRRARGPQRSTIVIVVVAVVVVLGALTALFFVTVSIPALTAAGALQQYATAIQNGDLAEAARLAPTPAGSAAPIGGDVLANAADRISGVSTSIVSSSGGAAVGKVAFTLGGTSYSSTVKLATGAAQLGLLPRWKVTTPLTATIAVKVPAQGMATVNGVPAPLGSSLTLTVYPGQYAVGLAADNTWYTSSTVTVAAGHGTVTATPTVQPTAALGAEVTKQVKAKIDACAATASPTPPGCPFSEPAVGKLANFSWHVDNYPTISFLDPTHVFLENGQATANFVLTYSYIINKTEADPIAIDGPASLSFNGTSVVVTIN